MTIANIFTKAKKIPESPWTIKDVVLVVILTFAISGIFYITLLELLGDNKTTVRVARYIGSLLMIFLPLFWIKKRYGLTKEALGLKRGNLYLSVSVLIGIETGLFYSLLIKLTIFKHTPVIDLNIPNLYIYLILLPISINGFATIILAPIGEEILDRGFIYGYLRRRLGITLGLILQALFFSLSHPNYLYGNSILLIIIGVVVGLIFGILYEKTGSIYTSIICHGTINYLGIIFKFIEL